MFPPDGYNQKRMEYFDRYYDVPSSVINVNSQAYPINTITGLQYFLGKPLNMRVYREKMSHQHGLMDSSTDAWVEELRGIMRGAGLVEDKQEPAPLPQAMPALHPLATARNPGSQTARQKTQYSQQTGRLIPPPSRAMSRGFSRQGGSREQYLNQMRSDVSAESLEKEAAVMGILCQILQTDDISAVKHWLLTASEREKALLMDMLRSAMGSKEQSKESYPTAAPPREAPVDYTTAKVDRLSLDGETPRKLQSVDEEPGTTMYTYDIRPKQLPPINSQNAQENERPVTTEPFRPSSRRPVSVAGKTSRPKTSQELPTEAKLAYTKSESVKAVEAKEE
jgi:hypothetical protein